MDTSITANPFGIHVYTNQDFARYSRMFKESVIAQLSGDENFTLNADSCRIGLGPVNPEDDLLIQGFFHGFASKLDDIDTSQRLLGVNFHTDALPFTEYITKNPREMSYLEYMLFLGKLIDNKKSTNQQLVNDIPSTNCYEEDAAVERLRSIGLNQSTVRVRRSQDYSNGLFMLDIDPANESMTIYYGNMLSKSMQREKNGFELFLDTDPYQSRSSHNFMANFGFYLPLLNVGEIVHIVGTDFKDGELILKAISYARSGTNEVDIPESTFSM